MSKAAGEEDTTGDVATGVTWSDIYESPQVDRSLRRLPRLCREAVRLVWAAGRHELLVVLAIKVVNGLGLAAVLLLGKGVLDEVIAAGRSGAGAGQVLPRLLLLTVVTASLGFLSAIGREHREILAELASRHAQSQIIDVAGAVELEAYDTPAFHDRLVRAAGGGQFRPWQVVEGLTGLAGAAIGIAGIALALLALQPWLVPLVLAAAVPLLIAVARGGELMFGFRHRMTEAERRRNYLYMLLSGKDAAKELRPSASAASCASATTGCTTSTWPSCARWPGGGCGCRCWQPGHHGGARRDRGRPARARPQRQHRPGRRRRGRRRRVHPRRAADERRLRLGDAVRVLAVHRGLHLVRGHGPRGRGAPGPRARPGPASGASGSRT